ncbi:hypothetical protein MF271_23720 (plasmid) [Deinococcus sp. KNUC1210]|uniref:hypothetical protein n=1 Tax=Deinococcus sp. KNUC1210 TaxID=2917691 RepID=UPI001EF0CD33|nr:hypothetical protein [Deinococcus sp. KNUC1210]ULH17973.1 hypothetical protein MF271_23720 [Deinococcus sp. KNUC1210]
MGRFPLFPSRLLELVTTEHIELDTVAGKLDTARMEQRPLTEVQQEALKAFALAFWDKVLSCGCFWPALMLSRERLQAFGVERAELLTAWRRHPQGAEVLADDLRLNGRVPAEWPHDDVLP